MTTGTIDTMKDSMTERRPDGYHACTKCDYTSRKKDHVREHVEKHIEGLEYPCSDCNKVFRSSHSFRSHRRSHKAQAIVKNEWEESQNGEVFYPWYKKIKMNWLSKLDLKEMLGSTQKMLHSDLKKSPVTSGLRNLITVTFLNIRVPSPIGHGGLCRVWH